MERITKSTLLSLLRRQCLDWLQVEIVVQMEEVKVLAMDEEIQHIVSLSTNLQASLNPIKLGKLEEFGLLKRAEQVSLVLSLGALMVQTVQDPALQEFLVADSNLDWVALRTVLFEPRGNEWYIARAACPSCSLVVGSWCPIEVDSICGILSV